MSSYMIPNASVSHWFKTTPQYKCIVRHFGNNWHGTISSILLGAVAFLPQLENDIWTNEDRNPLGMATIRSNLPRLTRAASSQWMCPRRDILFLAIFIWPLNSPWRLSGHNMHKMLPILTIQLWFCLQIVSQATQWFFHLKHWWRITVGRILYWWGYINYLVWLSCPIMSCTWGNRVQQNYCP